MTKNQADGRMIGNVQASRRAVLRGIAGGAAAAFLAAGWTVQAAQGQATTPEASPVEAEGPVKIVVLFGEPTDPAAFEEYYQVTHVPLALTMPYLQRIEAGKAVSAVGGGEPAFYRIAELYYADHADMEASLASPEGQEAFADVANFATGGVTATIVEGVQSVPGTGGASTPTA